MKLKTNDRKIIEPCAVTLMIREEVSEGSATVHLLDVATEAELARLKEVGAETLADLLLVSELVLVSPEEAQTLDGETAMGEEAGVKRLHSATLLVQEYARCERCWNYRESVGQAEPEDLCARCSQVVAEGA